MKSILSALAAGVFLCAGTAGAEPVRASTASVPIVLEAEAMDRVTAGIALLLPAVQQARAVGALPFPSRLPSFAIEPLVPLDIGRAVRDVVVPPRPVVIWMD